MAAPPGEGGREARHPDHLREKHRRDALAAAEANAGWMGAHATRLASWLGANHLGTIARAVGREEARLRGGYGYRRHRSVGQAVSCLHGRLKNVEGRGTLIILEHVDRNH